MFGQGTLERICNIREKSGNSNINGSDSHRKYVYLFCLRGKKILSKEIVQAALPPYWGLLL